MNDTTYRTSMGLSSYAHSSANEIDFIDRLGAWSLAGAQLKLTRLDLLRSYLRALNRRNWWGDIDKHLIERHTLMLIEREMVLHG